MRDHRRRLNCGITMPVLGFGTYSYPNDEEETVAAIRTALKILIRHRLSGRGPRTGDRSAPAGRFPLPPSRQRVCGCCLSTRVIVELYESYEFSRNDGVVAHTRAQIGYRHFDTAKIYGSEAAVGKALTAAMEEETGAIERGEVFVTSKLWSSDHHDPISALKKSLRTLGMDYVDMYLVHWPVKLKPWAVQAVPKEDEFEPKLEMEETWAAMERCLEMGLCRCIGVSNFSSRKILDLLDFASVTPAVNQVEMHPVWRQEKLRDVCEENGIHVSAYSPLGAPGNLWGSNAVVDSPIIQSIAQKHRATPAQVALQWGISKGASVIVKSFNTNRMRENMGALDVELDSQDLLQINRLQERKIMRGEFLVNQTSSPYRSVQDLWDGEI